MADQLRKTLRHRIELEPVVLRLYCRPLFVRLRLLQRAGSPQMRHQNQLPALFANIFDTIQRTSNTRIIRHRTIIVLRNIKVHAHQNTLSPHT